MPDTFKPDPYLFAAFGAIHPAILWITVRDCLSTNKAHQYNKAGHNIDWIRSKGGRCSTFKRLVSMVLRYWFTQMWPNLYKIPSIF